MRVRMQDMYTGAPQKTLSVHTAAGAKTVFFQILHPKAFHLCDGKI